MTRESVEQKARRHHVEGRNARRAGRRAAGHARLLVGLDIDLGDNHDDHGDLPDVADLLELLYPLPMQDDGDDAEPP